MNLNILLFVTINLFCYSLSGQSQVKTVPFVNHYSPEIYNVGLPKRAGSEIRSIAQNNNLIYFANENGLLIFDGNRWHSLASQGPLYEVKVDFNHKRVLVGGEGFFGYYDGFDPSRMQYISLSDSLLTDSVNFSKVFDISISSFGTFFTAPEDIFIYDDSVLKSVFSITGKNSVRNSNNLEFVQLVADTLYINCRNNGASIYNGGELKAYMPQAPDCFNQSGINQILPYNEDSIMISTRNLGLVLMANNPKECAFHQPQRRTLLDQMLREAQVTCAIELSNGLYVAGTKLNGIFLFDKDRNIIKHIYTENGLPANRVMNMHLDHLNNLWIGLSKGVAYLELNSPFHKIDHGKTLPKKINALHQQFGKLYIATSNGIFRQNSDISNKQLSSEIELIPDTEGESWALHKYNETNILVSHKNSIYLLDQNDNFISSGIYTQHTTKFEDIPNTPFIIGRSPNGFTRYTRKAIDSNIKRPPLNNKLITGLSKGYKNMIVDNESQLWITTIKDELLKIILNPNMDSVELIVPYSGQKGLPKGKVYIFKLHEGGGPKELLFSTHSGIYNYDQNLDSFRLVEDGLKNFLEQGEQLHYFRLLPNSSYNYLYLTNKEFGLVEIIPGQPIIKTKFNKPTAYINPSNHPILPLSNEVKNPTCLLGTNEGLWEFDLKNLLFDSLKTQFNIYVNEELSNNNVLFSFTTDFFQDYNLIEYKYRLCKLGGCEENTPWGSLLPGFRTSLISLFDGFKTLEVQATNTFGMTVEKVINIPKNKNRSISFSTFMISIMSLLTLLWYVWKNRKDIRYKMNKELENEFNQKTKDQQNLIEHLQEKENKYDRIFSTLKEKIDIDITSYKKKKNSELPIINDLEELKEILKRSDSNDDVDFIRDFNHDFPKIETDKKDKEARVAFYIVQGLSKQEIANLLDTSGNMVANYRTRIKRRLDNKNGEPTNDIENHLREYNRNRRKNAPKN